MQRIPSLYFAPSDLHGRGVFTAEALREGDLIEVCPVLVLPPSDREAIDATRLYHYYFLWGEKEDHYAFALGYGSLYNHAELPNARYAADYDQGTLSFYTIRPLPAGEEITVNYLGKSGLKRKLWFMA